jgi:putative heme-binding domain-containing protein
MKYIYLSESMTYASQAYVSIEFITELRIIHEVSSPKYRKWSARKANKGKQATREIGRPEMNRTNTLKYIFNLGSIACLSLAVVGHAQSLPEGKGQADFQRICSSCHSVSMATTQRMTQAEWMGVVNDMVSRGAQGTQDELNNVVTYLAANYGKDQAPAASGAAAPAPPPALVQTPLSEAEIEKGTKLLKANGCLSCHRVGDMGSYVGPNLTGIGASRSAEQIHAALVAPDKNVTPENRSVRLVTGDGKTVTGRILNQDGFSVQLIDSSDQLRSFQKAGLREFEIVTTNPMPSYASKMSAQDLTDLVHYLSSSKDSAKP